MMPSHPIEPGDYLPVEPEESEIREHAYQLWLNDGQVHGKDLEHWFTARQILRHRAHPGSRAARRAPDRPASRLPARKPARMADAGLPLRW